MQAALREAEISDMVRGYSPWYFERASIVWKKKGVSAE